MRSVGWTLASALLLLPSQGGGQDLDSPARKSIEIGLQWLMRAQNKDGSWGLDSHTPPDVTCTALSCMALMAAGNTEASGPHAGAIDAVRRGLRWTLDRARRMHGDIDLGEVTLIQGKLGQRVHNFFATVFLTQVYGMRGPWADQAELEQMKGYLIRLAEIIDKSQEPDGSWHRQTFGALKATAMAWLALRSIHSSGISIRHATVSKTVDFLKKQFNSSTKLFDAAERGGGISYQTLYNTASVLRVLCGMGEGRSREALAAQEELFKMLSDQGGQRLGGIFLSCEGEDFLAAAMLAHCYVREQGEEWRKWFPFLRDALVKKQNKDGSWTSTACISGRTFPTACALLALQAPNRLLPIIEQ